MPYFFTKMAKRFPHMEFIWPEEGAIVSPIFMLTKKEKIEQMQPLIDLMASKKMGKIFAKQGLFPSVLPEVDNELPKNAQFMWPGWHFLRENNPGKLLTDLEAEFNNAVEVAVV
jgi:ABC-type Fe3+ transport system substrate-binding protein